MIIRIVYNLFVNSCYIVHVCTHPVSYKEVTS